jgi:hypothetical protein
MAMKATLRHEAGCSLWPLLLLWGRCGMLDWLAVIDAHVIRRPEMEPRDVYKLLYQGILGLEHFIVSPQDFEARLVSEVESIAADEGEPLWESIRPDGTLGRLNLRPFKACGRDIRALNAACLKTAEQIWGTRETLRVVWSDFAADSRSGRWPLSWLEIQRLAVWLVEHDFPAVHHTVVYRQRYTPAYRLLEQVQAVQLGRSA